MKKRSILLSLFISLALCPQVQADLNTENVRKGLEERIITIFNEQGAEDATESTDSITLENITKIENLPISSNETFYAVKAKIVVGGKESSINLVVDESGQKELILNDLKTGETLFSEFKSSGSLASTSEEMGIVAYKGDGTEDIVLFSNPLCPYCSTVLGYLAKNLDKIKTLKVVHLVNETDRQSQVISWAIKDASKVIEHPMDLFLFIHRDLDLTPKTTDQEILKSFQEHFPELRSRWGGPEQATYYLEGKYKDLLLEQASMVYQKYKIDTVPTAHVNAKSKIMGWDKSKYEKIMED